MVTEGYSDSVSSAKSVPLLHYVMSLHHGLNSTPSPPPPSLPIFLVDKRTAFIYYIYYR